MLVPVKWLREYVDIKADTKEIANKVTDSGSHVESIQGYDGLSNLVVAKILEINKHENADNLSIVKLDLGNEELQVVTGAKNMKVSDNVVLAKVGATLPGGIEIGVAEFKGIKSPGMLCSYKELGVADNLVPKNSEEGIIILGDDVKPGNCAIKALDLDDQIIEFEITPNRPDCLSIIGMAREVAAVYDTKIKEPSRKLEREEDSYSDYFNGVEIETHNSKRFLSAVVKDIVIKESPLYIQNYLRNAGMRPISNIVDFTNFVMLEYGQPLHAYDLDTIDGKKIIVRQGREGETVKTIDQSERKIVESDIVIADGNSKAIGLAGVMGGFDTEVTDNTKTILIESANFNQESIRITSKRLGLRSEASSRFEKGVSPVTAEYAIQRFLKLIEETNSGVVVSGIEDSGEFKEEIIEVSLSNKASNSLLGIELSPEESSKYLEALEIETKVNGDEIIASIPYFRGDLRIEADLIEEIGRLYGFHNIKPKPLTGGLTQGVKSELRNFEDKVRAEIYSLGFSEVMTYSFISKKQYDKLNLEENDKLRNSIEILNPLGEDFSVMRTTLIGNMLDAIRSNLNKKQYDLRFTELGNTFTKVNDEIIETKKLVVALVGDYDYYYLKDVLEKLLLKINISNIRFEREENNPIFHTGRCANVIKDSNVLGTLGEISPIVLDNFDINQRVYLFELNVELLNNLKDELVQYKKISKYPLVERDIAFVIDKSIESQSIIDVIRENGGDYLKLVKLFDTYEGNQIGMGKISLAYKLGFQSDEYTLKEETVKEAFNNIEEGLKEAFNIEIRS